MESNLGVKIDSSTTTSVQSSAVVKNTDQILGSLSKRIEIKYINKYMCECVCIQVCIYTGIHICKLYHCKIPKFTYP